MTKIDSFDLKRLRTQAAANDAIAFVRIFLLLPLVPLIAPLLFALHSYTTRTPPQQRY